MITLSPKPTNIAMLISKVTSNAEGVYSFTLQTTSQQAMHLAMELAKLKQINISDGTDTPTPASTQMHFFTPDANSITFLHMALTQAPDQAEELRVNDSMEQLEREAQLAKVVEEFGTLEGVELLEDALVHISGLPGRGVITYGIAGGMQPMRFDETPAFAELYHEARQKRRQLQ